jgi:hypothetical protein
VAYTDIPSPLVVQVAWLADAYLQAGWCQGEVARNAHGEPVEADAKDAVSWCICGAIGRAARELDPDDDLEKGATLYTGQYDSLYEDVCCFVANTYNNGDQVILDINERPGQTQKNMVAIMAAALERA